MRVPKGLTFTPAMVVAAASATLNAATVFTVFRKADVSVVLVFIAYYSWRDPKSRTVYKCSSAGRLKTDAAGSYVRSVLIGG